MIDDVLVPMNVLPLDESDSNVSHFYVDVPAAFGLAPSTPKLSTIKVSTVASDHGKQEAQEKWIKRM